MLGSVILPTLTTSERLSALSFRLSTTGSTACADAMLYATCSMHHINQSVIRRISQVLRRFLKGFAAELQAGRIERKRERERSKLTASPPRASRRPDGCLKGEWIDLVTDR